MKRFRYKKRNVMELKRRISETLNTGTITAQTNNKKKRQKKNENKLKI
jgi:hypothetical protein